MLYILTVILMAIHTSDHCLWLNFSKLLDASFSFETKSCIETQLTCDLAHHDLVWDKGLEVPGEGVLWTQVKSGGRECEKLTTNLQLSYTPMKLMWSTLHAPMAQ